MPAATIIMALLATTGAELSSAERSVAAGEYRSGLSALEQIPEKERTANWYLLASKAWDGLDDSQKAVNMAQLAIDKNPESELAHLQLAQIFLSRNTPKAAFEILGDAKQKFPQSVLIRLGLGLALKEMRRYEEASVELRECLRMQPYLGTAFDALGGALFEAGRFEDLSGVARKYISDNPADYRGYYYLAAGLEKTGEQAASLQDSVRRSLELNPDFAPAHALLGKVLLDSGNLDAAITELERAIRLRPDYNPAHMYLSLAYARAGRRQDAQRERDELARLNEMQSRPVPHLLYHRGLKQ